jgi:hypothetical protein
MTPHIAGGSRLGLLKEVTGISIAAQTTFGIERWPVLADRPPPGTDVLKAALINGTSAHADLFDDNNAPMMAHPGSPRAARSGERCRRGGAAVRLLRGL